MKRAGPGDVSYLTSPRLVDVQFISFFYHMFGRAMGRLSLEAYIDVQRSNIDTPWPRRSGWAGIWSREGAQQSLQTEGWRASGALALPALTAQVRLIGVGGLYEQSEMSVDSVARQARAPLCAARTLNATGQAPFTLSLR